MTNTTYASSASMSGEIDLITMLQSLWGQKWLIAMVTLLITLVAASYAFLSKPLYEVRISLLPPNLSEVAEFNVARGGKSGLEPYSVGQVFTMFGRNLEAKETRRQFFNDVYLPSLEESEQLRSRDELYKDFSEILGIRVPDKSQQNYVVSIIADDPNKATEWAKIYTDQVIKQTLNSMLGNTRSEVKVRGEQIQQEIKTLREYAGIRRADYLVKLKEALKTAEAIGQVAPPAIGGQSAEQLLAFMSGNLMYMRGSKALRAEIEALESRTSDDPFIPALRSLEEQYSLLTGFQISGKNVAVAHQDGPVVTPDQPIKPKKALILALGVLLGIMVGFFTALARLMLSKGVATKKAAAILQSEPMT